MATECKGCIVGSDWAGRSPGYGVDHQFLIPHTCSFEERLEQHPIVHDCAICNSLNLKGSNNDELS